MGMQAAALSPSDPPWKIRTRPCPFFSQGKCIFAHRCNFIHTVRSPVSVRLHRGISQNTIYRDTRAITRELAAAYLTADSLPDTAYSSDEDHAANSSISETPELLIHHGRTVSILRHDITASDTSSSDESDADSPVPLKPALPQPRLGRASFLASLSEKLEKRFGLINPDSPANTHATSPPGTDNINEHGLSEANVPDSSHVSESDAPFFFPNYDVSSRGRPVALMETDDLFRVRGEPVGSCDVDQDTRLPESRAVRLSEPFSDCSTILASPLYSSAGRTDASSYALRDDFLQDTGASDIGEDGPFDEDSTARQDPSSARWQPQAESTEFFGKVEDESTLLALYNDDTRIAELTTRDRFSLPQGPSFLLSDIQRSVDNPSPTATHPRIPESNGMDTRLRPFKLISRLTPPATSSALQSSLESLQQGRVEAPPFSDPYHQELVYRTKSELLSPAKILPKRSQSANHARRPSSLLLSEHFPPSDSLFFPSDVIQPFSSASEPDLTSHVFHWPPQLISPSATSSNPNGERYYAGPSNQAHHPSSNPSIPDLPFRRYGHSRAPSIVSTRSSASSALPGSQLFFAIARDSPEEVARLLASGEALVNEECGPQTALAFASHNSHLQRRGEIVATLLSFGAEPNSMQLPSKDDDESCPLRERDSLDPYVEYFTSRARSTPAHALITALKHSSKYAPLMRLPFGLIGQDLVLQEFFRAIAMHELTGENTPLVFMLCGPSGHGKSLFARKIGDCLQCPSKTFNVTMSRPKHDLWDLLSIDHSRDDISALAPFLEANDGKRCVVILEEIEKTENISSLWSLLIPWELGIISFPGGMNINAKEVIWIATSNLGQDLVLRSTLATAIEQNDYASLMASVRGHISEHFGSSLISRVTAVLPFTPFKHEELDALAFSFLAPHLTRQGKTLSGDERQRVLEKVVNEYRPEEGARSVQRAAAAALLDL